MATKQNSIKRQIPQLVTLVIIVALILVVVILQPGVKKTVVVKQKPAQPLNTTFDVNALPSLEQRSTSYPTIVPDDLGGRSNPFAP